MKYLSLVALLVLTACGGGGGTPAPQIIDVAGANAVGCTTEVVAGVLPGINVDCGAGPVFIPFGVDGAKGDKGDTGTAGINGVNGNNGLDGQDGISCIFTDEPQNNRVKLDCDGNIIYISHGTDGLDGSNGADGVAGANGQDGQNGSSTFDYVEEAYNLAALYEYKFLKFEATCTWSNNSFTWTTYAYAVADNRVMLTSSCSDKNIYSASSYKFTSAHVYEWDLATNTWETSSNFSTSLANADHPYRGYKTNTLPSSITRFPLDPTVATSDMRALLVMNSSGEFDISFSSKITPNQSVYVKEGETWATATGTYESFGGHHYATANGNLIPVFDIRTGKLVATSYRSGASDLKTSFSGFSNITD